MKKYIFSSFLLCIFLTSCLTKEENFESNISKKSFVEIADISSWDQKNLNSFTSGETNDFNYYSGNIISNISKLEYSNYFVGLYQQATKELDIPIAMTFYSTEKMEDEITLVDLTAISAFKKIGNDVVHILYEKSNGSFQAIPQYTFKIKNIATNHMHFSMITRVKKIFPNTNTYLLVLNAESISQKGKTDEYNVKIAAYIGKTSNENAGAISRGPDEPIARCPSPCMEDSRADCEVYEDGVSQCYSNPGCSFTYTEDEYRSGNVFPSTFLDDAYRKDLLHQYRDEFLINTEIGEKYIMYYEVLSNYIKEDMDYSIAYNTVQLLPEINWAQTKSSHKKKPYLRLKKT